MHIERIDPRTDARYALELDLRYRVLRAPLGMSRAQVTFAGEEDAIHVLAVDGPALQDVLGCVLFDFASGRLRAMAVDPARQNMGIGARLVARLEQEAKAAGVRTIRLHARGNALGFYQRLGYALEGEPFLEVGIEHREMVKRI